MSDTITVEHRGTTVVVCIDRPQVRNAVDPKTAQALFEAFVAFDKDDSAQVAVLAGAGGTFCAGADLKSVAAGNFEIPLPIDVTVDRHARGPMGPSYLRLSKPVIGAVAGHAVAGGLELACWCDMRVVEEDAIFGVFCRRWGVPLVDGGTVRLPRIVGHGHAMDMILTGRSVGAEEARMMGLANKVVATGTAIEEAVAVAEQIAKFPQICMRNDRASAYEQWDMEFGQAMANESRHGYNALISDEARAGAARFASGKGRSGNFDDI